MVTGQNDSGLLTGDIGRPFGAVRSFAERVVSRSGSDDRATERSTEHRVRATSHPDGGESEQLVPPRERLLGLLERNDGRMRQSDIVEAVEWSESTVSRKLGALESSGEVTRYRIGRGKIVVLPGAEPECMGSALEQEEPPLAA